MTEQQRTCHRCGKDIDTEEKFMLCKPCDEALELECKKDKHVEYMDGEVFRDIVIQKLNDAPFEEWYRVGNHTMMVSITIKDRETIDFWTNSLEWWGEPLTGKE